MCVASCLCCPAWSFPGEGGPHVRQCCGSCQRSGGARDLRNHFTPVTRTPCQYVPLPPKLGIGGPAGAGGGPPAHSLGGTHRQGSYKGSVRCPRPGLQRPFSGGSGFFLQRPVPFSFLFLFFYVYLFILRERERERVLGGAEREREGIQAGSALSAWSPMRGSNPQTKRP